MRTCNSCGEDKPSAAFGRNKAMADGLLKVCKSCMNAKQRDRAKTPRGRALNRRHGKKYREQHAAEISRRAAEKRRADPETARRVSRESAARVYRRNPEAGRRATRDWAARHPERRRAQRALNHAVEVGLVTPATHCQDCGRDPGRGADGRRLIQGHHHDYTKPLAVAWLCPPCHKAADADRTVL